MHLSGTLLVRLSSTLCHIPIKDEHFLLLELLIWHKNNGKKDGLTYKKVLFMTRYNLITFRQSIGNKSWLLIFLDS